MRELGVAALRAIPSLALRLAGSSRPQSGLKPSLKIGISALAILSLNLMSLPASLAVLSATSPCAPLVALSIAPLISSERIFGMQPLTFLCFAIPIVIQVAILLIWALRWRSPD